MKKRIQLTRRGDLLKKTIIEKEEEGGHAIKKIEYWTVKKVYLYVVLAERGGNRECFDIGWLVQNGYEYQYKVPTGKLHSGHHKDKGAYR